MMQFLYFIFRFLLFFLKWDKRYIFAASKIYTNGLKLILTLHAGYKILQWNLTFSPENNTRIYLPSPDYWTTRNLIKSCSHTDFISKMVEWRGDSTAWDDKCIEVYWRWLSIRRYAGRRLFVVVSYSDAYWIKKSREKKP